MFKNPLLITDNSILLVKFLDLIANTKYDSIFDIAISKNSDLNIFQSVYNKTMVIDLKSDFTIRELLIKYDLIISLHCKQLFPIKLISKIKCINIHPGYNPNNRGWYPQVFSIINNEIIGATIHEIDEFLDNGPIIARREVEKYSWDTSLSLYNRILECEIELLKENMENIMNNKYLVINPESQGNLFLKKDFNKLLEINLNENLSFEEAITRLRALTHGNYNNAYFIDPISNNKIYVKIVLTPSNEK